MRAFIDKQYAGFNVGTYPQQPEDSTQRPDILGAVDYCDERDNNAAFFISALSNR